MNHKRIEKGINSKRPYLIAFHSCTTTLGVAIIDSRSPETSLTSSTFSIGRDLSNKIISCVEELLPSTNWQQLDRIAVSIGPGGFTSTRVTVVMARILAQQLNCDLDGISSFALMAPRLENSLEANQKGKPFWIKKTLPRRGIVAGKYQVEKNSSINNFKIGIELERPHLLPSSVRVNPSINASEDVNLDVLQLLRISFLAKIKKENSHWRGITPIYPTSPVD